MSSPEIPKPSLNTTSKLDLLIELAIVDELIQPYLEAALAIDEIHKLDDLLEQRDSVLEELSEDN